MKQQKKYGIWGFGVVGKAGLRYFYKKNISCHIFEQRSLTDDERTYGISHNGFFFNGTITDFLDTCDYIYVSPGIDLRPYQNYNAKWISELDLFTLNWKKPIIAVTGSVGKTTLVTLLLQALESCGMRVAVGGNIGTACLDLCPQQKESDIALLEVSSFQLDSIKKFAPDIGIITNIYPNHLDRHGDMQNYIDAKFRLFQYQQKKDCALIPFSLKKYCSNSIQSSVYLFDLHNAVDYATFNSGFPLYFIEDASVYLRESKVTTAIARLTQICQFKEQELILHAILHRLGKSQKALDVLRNTKPLEHRLELVGKKMGAFFYNDSKSTIPASTLAALTALDPKPTLLFLGGLSKGTDRRSLIHQLPSHIAHVICFGQEAKQLHSWCIEKNISSFQCATLDDAFHIATMYIKPNMNVLFSPAGSSFDLFKNYQERGTLFKQLVDALES